MLPMSTTGEDKVSTAAILHPVKRPGRPGPGAAGRSPQAEATPEGSMENVSLPPRPATPSRVSPSGRFAPHSYADPCNYLG
jgi:hypothetical protein